MDETVKSEHFVQYLLDTQQMPEFARWEQKQTAVVSVASGK